MMDPSMQMLLEAIQEDVRELKQDMKVLMGERARTAGITMVVGMIITAAFQLVLLLYNK